MIVFSYQRFRDCDDRGAKTALEFAIDRSIRIYIVALPVLLIALTLAFCFPGVSDRFPGTLSDRSRPFF